MKYKAPVMIIFLFCVTSLARAGDLEGDYLYKVTTIRAATGALADLLEWEARLGASRYFDEAGQERPLLMRHSQGDQWDLLVIVPMKSWTEFHSRAASEKRSMASARHAELIAAGEGLFAFYEDHFAYGPPWSVLRSAYADNRFFHIEMFHAAPGKAGDLLEQRRMENAYLESTGQTPNMIFRRAAGSDVDVFTIGFHPSFEAFAAPANVTAAEKEREAKAAGVQGPCRYLVPSSIPHFRASRHARGKGGLGTVILYPFVFYVISLATRVASSYARMFGNEHQLTDSGLRRLADFGYVVARSHL